MRKRFVFIAPLAVAAVFLFGLLVMVLWNGVVAPATGWHASPPRTADRPRRSGDPPVAS